MKKAVLLTVVLLLLFASASSVYAIGNGTESLESTVEERFFGTLDDQTADLLEKFGLDSLDGENVFTEGIENIKEYFSVTVKDKLKQAMLWFFSVLCIIMLLSVISNAFDFSASQDVLNVFSAAIICMLTVSKISSFLNCTLSAMTLGGKFMLSFIPVFALLISLSGNPASALTYNSFLLFFCEIISFFLENIFVSLTGFYFSLSIAFSFNPTVNLTRFINGSNRITSLMLGFSATLFTSLLSVKNVLAVSADSLSVKGARFLLSSLVPIIGSSLSEAYSSLLGSINLMKNSLAVVGIFAIAVINVPSMTEGVIYFFLITLLSCLAETTGLYRISEVFRSIASCVRILLLINLFQVFILIISIGIMMSLR